MLWSFPALLDIDRGLARRALEYALTMQLRNTGTRQPFIRWRRSPGRMVFELDEAAAPLVALAAYVGKTGDDGFRDA